MNTHLVRIIAAIALLATGTQHAVSEEQKTHFHGYGELHYNNSIESDSEDQMDHHRLVLGWRHEFDSRISLNVEIDFEHAAQEMELEFAFVDFRYRPEINFRAGSMLMPMGYLNEHHEPPLFYSVERPYVQKYIIPTTWQEGGAGIFGTLHDMRYRVYAVNGLDASGFTAKNGLRKGRSKVSESPSNDFAIVGRADYSGIRGIRIGVSGYTGGADQNAVDMGDVSVGIIEADAVIKKAGFELTGLISGVFIDGTEDINTSTGEVVGERLSGMYGEAAYHFGHALLPDDHDVIVFARHERFNTQDDVADGFEADPKNERSVTTLGAAYKPIEKVIVKCDVELWENDADESWEQMNLGIGYMY